MPQARIAPLLEPIFAAFSAGRRPGESFGDFCHRQGPESLLALGEATAVA